MSGAKSTLPDPLIQQKVDLLESKFNLIHQQRMGDIPILNDKIKVTAVGFQHWQKSYLGILITPWFMNLMLLPGKSENWDNLELLNKHRHHFPSGSYTFITGHEDGIGKYQMCSLFSPMFDFADHDAAVETAEVAIQELLNADNVEQIDIDSQRIENIWNGVEEKSGELAPNSTEHPALTEKLEKPISRRELLRSALLQDDKAS